MLSAYRELATEREAQGVPALPLNAEQTQGLTQLLQNPPAGEEQFLLHLLSERIPPGVDEAAYVKATWLSAVAQGDAKSPRCHHWTPRACWERWWGGTTSPP